MLLVVHRDVHNIVLLKGKCIKMLEVFLDENYLELNSYFTGALYPYKL